MPEKNLKIVSETFQRLIRRRLRTNSRNMLEKLHPADIAGMFHYLRENERKEALNLLENSKKKAQVLAELNPEYISETLSKLSSESIAKIMSGLPADDIAKILDSLEEPVSEKVIKHLNKEDYGNVGELLKHGEETAGRIMTTDFFYLPADITVGEAIQRLQKAERIEMVFYIYIVDDQMRLIGVASLRRLITVPPDTLLKDIASTDIISVRPYVDQEDVAALVARYDLLAIPVVEENGVLLGLVTVDDVIDVIQDEAAEDIHKMAGTEEVVIGSPWGTARGRLPWQIIRWLGGVAAFFIILSFQSPEFNIWIVAPFIPLILGVAETSGLQSSATVSFAISMRVVHMRLFWRLLVREILSTLSTALGLSLIAGSGAYFLLSDPHLAYVVGGASAVTMLASALIGTSFPLLLERVRLDPAIASAPLISAFLDILSISIFFFAAGRCL